MLLLHHSTLAVTRVIITVPRSGYIGDYVLCFLGKVDANIHKVNISCVWCRTQNENLSQLLERLDYFSLLGVY